jgi:YD repeat-containing protein
MKINVFSRNSLCAAIGLILTFPTQAVVYEYDALNRLISARYTSGNTLSYTYDAAGNILSIKTLITQNDTNISGQLLDSNEKPIAGATITVGDKTVKTDNNGNYQISGLSLGTYTVTASKEGYSFAPTQITLDSSNTSPKINLTGTFTGKIAQIAVGAYSCQNNSNQIILVDGNGQIVKTIDSTISGNGIDVTTSDWNLDKTVDFLIASGLFSGNEAFVFDTSGKKLSTLPFYTLNKGLKVVFGKFENGAVAIVVNQGEDKKLYIYPNGKESYSLDILKNAADVNIVAADLDGDGIDEIIVLSAKQINGTNALVLDSKGKSKASLLLTLDGVSATTKLPGLVGTAFVDQDKTILALGNAEGSTHRVTLYSFDKDFKASFVKSFTPFVTTNARRKNEKVTVCHNGKDLEIASSALPAHLGHGDTSGSCSTTTTNNSSSGSITTGSSSTSTGTSLTTDNSSGATMIANSCNIGVEGLLLNNTLQDGKPILLVAQNGNTEIQTFDTNGLLLKTLPLNINNQAITSLAGTNIDVSLPVISELPPPGVALTDVSVIGTPEKPLEVEDHEVDGHVHFENVVIGKITITINANITFGQNVRFKHKDHIPKGANLGNILPKIQQVGKKVKKHPHAINLTQRIVINAPTILQQIQAQVPTLQQEQTTGNLTVDSGEQRFTLKPVKIKQGDGSKSKGFNFEMTGKITFVTEEDHEVELIPTMEEVDQLSDTLEQGGIGGLEAADSGQLTASLIEAPNQVSYSGIPEMFSTPVDDSTPEGLQPVDAPNLAQGNLLLRALIFKDKHGKKRKQTIYPYFGQLGMGQIDLNGIVSLIFNNTTYRGMLDYSVIFGTNNNGLFDVQPKGDGSFMISYPSGKQQTFYPFK